MKIFITGGGLLGAFAARRFVQQGHTCIIFDRENVKAYVDLVAGLKVSFIQGDIRDTGLIDSLLKHNCPDVVIHTAAVMGDICESDLAKAYDINVTATLNLIERVNFYGIKRFVFTSSLAVYDFDDPELILDEKAPKTKDDLYGLGKLEVEDQIRNIATLKQIKFTSLRFSGVYGYCPGFGGAWMCAQIAKIIERLEFQQESKTNEPIILDGAELGWNEYLYCEDAAEAIVASAFVDDSLCCNVGSGRITSPSEIAAAFNKLYPNNEIIYAPPSVAMPSFKLRRHPLPTKLAEEYLNWYSRYDNILLGLKRTIDWYRSDLTSNHALLADGELLTYGY